MLPILLFSQRQGYPGFVLGQVSLPLWEKDYSLTLVGNPSSNAVTTKVSYKAVSNWFPVSCYPFTCEKTRCIEPFYSKINMLILFICHRWKKEHFSYVSILKITKKHQRISFKQRVLVMIKWSIYLCNISYACIMVQVVFNSFHFLFE